MDQIKRNLYELLFSCKGNWRNAIYVPCGPCPHPCKVDRSGCLAATRYLTWEMSSSEQCPMEYLARSSFCTLVPKYQKQKGDLV